MKLCIIQGLLVIAFFTQFGRALADVAAAYILGAPAMVAGKATYTLSLNFQATGGERLVYFGVDVASSDSSLTVNRTDFTGFSFSKAAPLLNEWNQIPEANFGMSEINSSVEYETAIASLGSGTYVLGELTVDLKGLDLPSNPNAVRIDAVNSVIGVETPGTPQSFRFVTPQIIHVPLGGNHPPLIAGTVANQQVTGNGVINPFSSATISDEDIQTLTVTLALDHSENGELSPVNLFTKKPDNSYEFSGTATAATTAIRGLTFSSSSSQSTSQRVTRFTISVRDGIAEPVVDSNTTVIWSRVVSGAPTLTLSGNSEVNEGGTYTLNLAASGSGADTINNWSINWGDGAVQTVSANPSSVTHSYADGPNSFNISAQATTPNGTFQAGNTVAVSVNNVAPTITLGGANEVDAGAGYTLTLGTVFDPGSDSVSQYVVRWGDGSQETHPTRGDVVHTYATGPATHLIAVDLVDEDGTYAGAGTKTITVRGTAPPPPPPPPPPVPVVTLSGSSQVNEGATYTLNLTTSNLGSATLSSWTINWGEGAPETVQGNPGSVTHVYADGPNLFTISAQASIGGVTRAANNTVGVAVNNVAPSISLSGADEVNQGSTYQLTLGPGSDPGQDSVTQYVVRWGDGGQDNYSAAGAVQHTYSNGVGTQVIVVDVVDEDGTHAGVGSKTVTVKTSPVPAIIGDSQVSEGATYTLSLFVANLGSSTISNWLITWGDGAVQTVEGNPSSVPHVYADGPNSFTISAQATGQDGTFAAASNLSVTVKDVAPTIELIGSDEAGQGSTYALTLGTVTDPGLDTVVRYLVDWGDGNQEIYNTNGAVTHTYANAPSTRLILVDLVDEDGTHARAGSKAVAVRNIPPTGILEVNEGAIYTLNLSQPESSANAITKWAITWGDGTVQTVDGNPNSVTHVFADGPNSFTILAQATFQDGTTAAGNTVAVSVKNVAPVIELRGVREVDEGAAYTLTLGRVIDPGADRVSEYIVHWGDGKEDTYTSAGDVTHVYADGLKERTIIVDLVDEDGRYLDVDSQRVGLPTIRREGGRLLVEWQSEGVLQAANEAEGPYDDVAGDSSPHVVEASQAYQFYRVLRSYAVRVRNVAPMIELSGAREVDEGAIYTLSLGRVIDPGADQVSEYVVHWGDGKEDTYTSAGDVTHVYADGPIERTITVDLVDEDGRYLDVDSKRVGLPAIRREGGRLLVEWQGGGVLQAANAAEGPYDDVTGASSPYLVEASQAYQFYRVLRSYAVRVRNVAPMIELSGLREVDEGATYTLTLGRVIDPGTDTVREYLVHWGDGQDDTYRSAGEVTHIYADGVNLRTITVDLVDEDGRFVDADSKRGGGVASIRRDGERLMVEWEGWGILQVANEADGQFEDVANAVSPYVIAEPGSHKFYRVLRSHAVRVRDVAPAIELSGPHEVNEGAVYRLTLGPVSDPGEDTVREWVVHWGDGKVDSYPSRGEVTHVYADGPAERMIAVDLVDEEGTHLDAATNGGVGLPSIRRESDRVVVEWAGWGLLQVADEVVGPYRDLREAVSPYSAPVSTAQQFYRVLRKNIVWVRDVAP